MIFRIFHRHKEAARRAEEAAQEAEESRRRLAEDREHVIEPLKETAGRNRFADMIRASLMEGRHR